MHPPGSRIADRYLVEARLGAGGMGEVLRVRDERLNRVVALKVLSAASIGNTAATSRLIREAQATAALEHPNIVPIYDVGATDNGGAYLAMQLVKGESLRERLERDGTLTLEETRRIVGEIGAALSCAHKAGIVHRDIKPDNVMLREEDGRVIVLDFGLAKHVEADADLHTLTADGAIIGTPAYLSPEQARGHQVDGQTDQFALGVMTYEMLAGRIPWKGTTLTALLTSLISDEPPPLTRELPPAVPDALRRALAKDPAARFPSVQAFVDALRSDESAAEVSAFAKTIASGDGEKDAVAQALANTQASTSAPKSRRTGAVLALVLGAVALAMVAWVATRTPDHDTATDGGSASDEGPPGLYSLAAPNPPAGCSDAAAETFRRGLGRLRFGNWGEACDAFEEAAEVDPGCATAQLHLANCAAGANLIDDKGRTAMIEAGHEQSKLTEREQALYDALELLLLHTPPDRAGYARALSALPTRFPNDAELLVYAADQGEAPNEQRIAWAERALEIDAEYSDAYQILARAKTDAGLRDEAHEVLARCRENVRLSSDCIGQELTMLRDEGRCDEGLTLVNALRLLNPDHHNATSLLARLLASVGRPESTVRRTLTELDRFDESPGLIRDRVLLALGADAYYGHLDAVVAGPAQLEDADDDLANIVAYLAVEALVELGRDDEAARLAAETVEHWPAELGRVRTFPGLVLAERRALMRARPALDAETYAALSARRDTLEDDAPAVGPANLWAARTAWSVTDEASAREALAELGETPPAAGEPGTVGLGGHVLALAGRTEEAIGRLRILARGCMSLVQPFLTLRALVWLGDAYEAAGNHDEACAAYREVVSLWGENAPEARTTRQARERLERCTE